MPKRRTRKRKGGVNEFAPGFNPQLQTQRNINPSPPLSKNDPQMTAQRHLDVPKKKSWSNLWGLLGGSRRRRRRSRRKRRSSKKRSRRRRKTRRKRKSRRKRRR